MNIEILIEKYLNKKNILINEDRMKETCGVVITDKKK